MRTSSAALGLALALAGCGQHPPTQPAQDGQATTLKAKLTQTADERIECGAAGEAFERSCTVEKRVGRTGTTLTLRQPDGGFHRLNVTSDGRIMAADGAEPAQVSTTRGISEVVIGGMRYRLPQ